MEKSEYVQNMFHLLHTELSESDYGQQTQLADNGQDIYDGQAEADIPISDNGEMPENQEGTQMAGEPAMDLPMSDMSYLDVPGNQTTLSNDVVNDVSEEKKLLKVYNLLKDLLYYGKSFSGSLEKADLSILEEEKEKEVFKDLSKRAKRVIDKINFYLEYSFNKDKYEKAVYTYILLRTELLAIIEKFRKELKIGQEDDQR